MSYTPKRGDVIRMHHWHGIVLERFTGDTGIILKVQTARNVFRKMPPELIEISNDSTAVAPATHADLLAEIEQHRRIQDSAINAMLAAADVAVEVA